MSARLEISLSTFDAQWSDLVHAAAHADDIGVGGLWLMDHLTGAVHGRHHVLECLAALSGLAGVTRSCRLGSLVLNCGLRHPSVVAQATATIQLQCHGRLVVGVGAGGGAGSPYAAEMVAAGLSDDPSAARRGRVEDTLAILARRWSGSSEGHDGRHYRCGNGGGFLAVDPAPRTLVAGFGPKMAALAGSMADGFNTHASSPDLEQLYARAGAAARDAGRPAPERSAFDVFHPDWLDVASARRRRHDEAGTDVLILVIPPPFDHGLIADIVAASRP